MSNRTYLTTKQLSLRMPYTAATIRNTLMDNVLLEGVHYIRPFGRRKILFIWEAIEKDMQAPVIDKIAMPASRSA
jgi:hypothetical protein